MRRALGLAVSLCVAAAAVAACRPSGDSGYVEIKTVPVTPVTKTALYLDATKLAPIKEGSTVLRQPVGTLKLQTDGKGGAMASLCDIEVKKDRITTVTVSILERPPRCECRFGGGDAAARACVS